MRELGRVGAQLGHHDAQVGVQPGAADRLLDEAPVEHPGPHVRADVHDPVGRRGEAEVPGHRGDGAAGEQVAVHRRRLQHGHVGHAVLPQVPGQEVDQLGVADIGAVGAVIAQHERHPDGGRAGPPGQPVQARPVQALGQDRGLVGVGPAAAHHHLRPRAERPLPLVRAGPRPLGSRDEPGTDPGQPRGQVLRRHAVGQPVVLRDDLGQQPEGLGVPCLVGPDPVEGHPFLL